MLEPAGFLLEDAVDVAQRLHLGELGIQLLVGGGDPQVGNDVTLVPLATGPRTLHGFFLSYVLEHCRMPLERTFGRVKRYLPNCVPFENGSGPTFKVANDLIAP